MHWQLALIIAFILLYLLVRAAESRALCDMWSELRRLWRVAGVPGRALAIAALILATQSAGSKGIAPVTKLMRMVFWTPGSPWQLMTAASDADAAAAAVGQATDDLTAASAATNSAIWTLSFDWHAPERLPYHDQQNVLAYVPWVFPTNIGGVAYEDHCVAFNAVASTNPAVIMIEYARRLDDGTVERHTSGVVTSSYPHTRTVALESGSYECYWFRCAVPVPYTNSVRDWSGEALFGAPYDSGKGFDLLGTLVVDDGNEVWVGANTNMVFCGTTNIVRNGAITED
jgi:hypothetical protein